MSENEATSYKSNLMNEVTSISTDNGNEHSQV